MGDTYRITVDVLGIWFLHNDEPVKFIGLKGLKALIQMIEQLRTLVQSSASVEL